MKLILEGKGVDETPSVGQLATPLPIVYCGFDKTWEVALLQGWPGVGVTEGSVVLKWNTLYGYCREEDKYQYQQDQQWERTAFEMGYVVFNAVLKELEATPGIQSIASENGEKTLEINLEDILRLRDRIIGIIENKFVVTGRLTDRNGGYKWIGLGSHIGNNVQPPTTPIGIPNILEGGKPLTLTGSPTPYSLEGDSLIHTMDDKNSTAVWCGLIHGFEAQPAWMEKCAIRAAFLQYVLNGNADLDVLLAINSRAGLIPRLSSVDTRGNGPEPYAWKRIVALGIAWHFFNMYYLNGEWRQPVGQVRFSYPGQQTGPVLEQKLLRYTQSPFITVSEETKAMNGLFFFPSTNVPGTEYGFNFVRYMSPYVAGSRTSIIEPIDIAPRYVKWENTPIPVDRLSIMSLTEEQQTGFKYQPVLIEPSRSVRTLVTYMGAGLRGRQMVIRDRLDKLPWEPSEVTRSMIIGWNPAYEPRSMVFHKLANSAMLDDYKDFEVQEGLMEGRTFYVPPFFKDGKPVKPKRK